MDIDRLKLEDNLKDNLKNLSEDIKGILNKYGDVLKLSKSDLESKNPDELFLIRQNEEMIEELLGMYHHLEHISSKVNMIGKLSISETLRPYLKEYDYYFSEGQIIEFLGYDILTEKEMWMISILAKNEGKYFIFNYPGIKLDGLKVRVRKVQ